MSHTQTLSGTGANRLPETLGPAIDESIVRKITSLSVQVRGIEPCPEQAEMVRCLKQEISNLEDQLADLRQHCA